MIELRLSEEIARRKLPGDTTPPDRLAPGSMGAFKDMSEGANPQIRHPRSFTSHYHQEAILKTKLRPHTNLLCCVDPLFCLTRMKLAVTYRIAKRKVLDPMAKVPLKGAAFPTANPVIV